MWRHFLLALAVLVFSETSEAQQSSSFDASRMRYLLAPIESIVAINRKKGAQREELIVALREACGALEGISKDEEFHDLLVYLEERGAGGLSPEAEQIYRDFNAFMEFLKIERETLLEHLPEEAVDEILSRLVAARTRVQNFQVDDDVILSSLNDTMEATCTAAYDLGERAERDQLINRIGRASEAILGVTAIAYDGVLLATPATIPFGLVSSAIGGYMVWSSSQ